MEPDNVNLDESPRPRRHVQEIASSNSYGINQMDRNVSSRRRPVQPPIIIGVGGASCSGKTRLCDRIKNALPEGKTCTRICLGWFYNRQPVNGRNSDEASYNFDHPDAFAFGLLREKLQALGVGHAVMIRRYDFSRRGWVIQTLESADVIILDGILALHESLINELDVKVFVERDADLCLAERIRKYQRKGKSSENVLMQYERSVRPGYLNFVRMTREYADLIIPGEGNDVGVDIIKAYLENRPAIFSEKLKTAKDLAPACSKMNYSDTNIQRVVLNSIQALLKQTRRALPEDCFIDATLATYAVLKSHRHDPGAQSVCSRALRILGNMCLLQPDHVSSIQMRPCRLERTRSLNALAFGLVREHPFLAALDSLFSAFRSNMLGVKSVLLNEPWELRCT